MKIEAGKYYRTRDGRKAGPMKLEKWDDGQPWADPAYTRYYSPDGRWCPEYGTHPNDLVAEWIEPEDARAQATVESLTSDDFFHSHLADGTPIPPRAIYSVGPLTAEGYEKLSAALKSSGPGEIRPLDVEDDGFRTVVPDVKAAIADEAKNIVSGARRAAYGRPEQNFERISYFWTAYAKAKGWPIEITAADVSPMMRLVKEARIVESPGHRDSHVDLVGYTLTGAEVNGVSATKAGA